MTEETESTSGKKRRIIHWNPDAGRETAARRWTWKRLVAWSVGGFFVLLFAAGIVIRAAKLVLGPEIFSGEKSTSVAGAEAKDLNSIFISQAKAEQLHEIAAKVLLELRRIPPDHPVQLEQMIVIQKSFNEGEAFLRAHEYAKSFRLYEALNRDLDAYSRNIKAKGEAKLAYDALLLRVRDLEIARALAPGALERAMENAAAGRQSMNDGNFTGAKKVFAAGFAELKKAEQALADYVRENLLRGQQALTKGEKQEAIKAFQAAQEKAPGNEDALRGMKRAENIDRVYALLQQGEKLEKQAQYADAAESYQKAFALDSLSAVAQAGQARAARLEKETKYATAKTAADAAFKRRDWAKAISEAESALKVYPQKPEVVTLLKSARENAHKDAVQKALAKAYTHENQHLWKEARDAYNETMQLEPELQDAKEGYMRSGTVIRALLEYEKRIEVAEQLANKAEFQAALRRFNEAMAVKPSYLEPSDRVQQLRSWLMSQSQPVDVTFKSDGKTYVSISAFKLLGLIETTTVRVMPGDYEIIGRRRGYKDVNMLLQVRNGTTPPLVTVTCADPAKG